MITATVFDEMETTKSNVKGKQKNVNFLWIFHWLYIFWKVIEGLNKENSLLTSEKDELNKQILEQTRQLSGDDPSLQCLTEMSFCWEWSMLYVFL